MGCTAAPEAVPETTEAPPVTVEPTTEATTEPVTEPTQPEPEPVEYVLSFVGDCCLANLKGWSKDAYFMGTVGEDYAYPFAGVKEYFVSDECTFINLEGALTETGFMLPKAFNFKGSPAYVNILTENSVEAVSLANNHSMDYSQEGYDNTRATLDAAGIPYAQTNQTNFHNSNLQII